MPRNNEYISPEATAKVGGFAGSLPETLNREEPTREEVIQDVQEKLKSINGDNVEKIVYDLIKKYFDNVISFSLTHKVVFRNKIILIKNCIKNGDLEKKKDLQDCFNRLINICYPEGATQVDDGNTPGVKHQAEGSAEEITAKIGKDQKDMVNNQSRFVSEIPPVLTEHSLDFKSWNNLKIKYEYLDDTSGLTRYQEAIKREIDSENTLTKQAAYQKYDSMIKYGKFKLADAMTYASIIGVDIEDYGQFKCFIGAVCDKIPKVAQGKSEYLKKYNDYKRVYKDYEQEMVAVEDQIITQIYTESLTARYETATTVAKGRSFYEPDKIQFFKSSDDQQQSGVEIASNISGIDENLLDNKHYTCKPDRTENEEKALIFTAFDTTFKSVFNLSNPIIEKLAAQQVDLRADFISYYIYNQDTNSFDEAARNEYVAEKLVPIGLTSDEIKELGDTMKGFPAEVKKNYEILSNDFYSEQDNFEKITKIFALGSIIDNIRNLFSNKEKLKDLENAMGSKFDEKGFEFDEHPADIIGDCLFLKGKINGTETNIKYDLRTGKLYMNSFTQEYFNPDKIIIGNKEPNTEIGNLENFNTLLEGYQVTPFINADNKDYSQTSNDNVVYNDGNIDSNDSNQDSDESNNEISKQKALESLMENRLAEIGDIVKKKALELGNENDVIDKFLKTFNILRNDSNLNTSMDIEFVGGSSLFTILKGIKNTDNEQELTGFSFEMNKLMELCGFKWGENNTEPREDDSSSVSISDITKEDIDNVKNYKDIDNIKDYEDIISLQEASQTFFTTENGENGESNKRHFDASAQISLANIIVEKCGKNVGGIRSVSADNTRNFVENVINKIEDIKDKKSLAAVESIILDDSMWT